MSLDYRELANLVYCVAKGPLATHHEALARALVEKLGMTRAQAEDKLATTSLVMGVLAGLLLEQDRGLRAAAAAVREEFGFDEPDEPTC